MTPTWIDTLSMVSNFIAALAAVAIPIVLYRWAKLQKEQSQKLEMETRTLSEMDNLNRRVGRAMAEIKSRTEDDFSYAKISGDSELEGFVFEVLNQYAYICLGANKGLFVGHIIMDLRGNALQRTRNQQFGEYIQEYRSKRDPQAWKDIDIFLGRIGS